MEEVPNATWGMVVESDEVYSAKSGKWYEVQQRVTTSDGNVKVKVKGIPKYLPVKAAGFPVRLRRGKTGRVVDLFQIIFSGATSPETVGATKEIGTTLDDLEALKDRSEDDGDE